MNYGAHLAVAQEVKPLANEALYFSVMAPDFAKMAGTQLRYDDLRRFRSRGTKLHIATDVAFHSLPLFLELKAEARSELKPFFEHRPADGYAHIGTEILLDGVLFRDIGLSRSFDYVMGWALDHLESLGEMAEDPDRFKAVIVDRAEVGSPPAYQDPEAVAGIVHRRVSNGAHPKLEFSEEHIPHLAQVYKTQQMRLREYAYPLLNATIEAL